MITKSSNKRNKVVIVLVALIVVLLILLVYFIFKPVSRRDNNVTLLNFQVGDTLNGYDIYDEHGSALDISKISDMNTMIIFAWDLCGDCKAEYANFKLLFEYYNVTNLDIVFVWDKNIPYAQLETLGIPREKNYSAKNEYKFTDWVPSYIIVNEKEEIIFKDIDLGNAGSFIKDNFMLKANRIEDIVGENLVLVGLDGCGSCKETYDYLTANWDAFIFERLIYICDRNETKTINPNLEFLDVIYDEHLLLSKALGVEDFPVLLMEGADGVQMVSLDGANIAIPR